ncbi:DUF6625 family protein [Lacticaseibacillus pantheris]|uniref:DUF6625 family protein n=1 Tax=Lacticaseibacillus pantheris TaxID=171523 RepID=UPI0034E235C5
MVPYFGQFKNYFQLFLNSCKKNPDFDWLFITDSDFNYDVPDNVRVVKSTFNQVKERVQSKFTFKVNLSSPYKLCDLKPMYGYIFEDYLVDYPFWGYCDVDVIWGRISDFVADQEFDKFDKIGDLGHCTFVRNSKSVNRLFMSKLNGTERYKQVLEDDQNESFDEEYDKSINNIFAEEGLSILPLRQMANIYTKSSYFRITSLGDNHKYSVGPVIKGFFLSGMMVDC